MLPAVVQLNRQEPKRVVLCITRDISKEDHEMLSEYGKVLAYDHNLHNNLDCDVFEWAYLIIDLRKTEDRYYFSKVIQPKKERYSIGIYHFVFEDEDFMDPDDLIVYFTSFPKKQATREIFNTLLLNSRIKKPRAVVSLFKCCLNLYSKVK